MPANTPEEVHELFVKYYNAADREALLSLYEPGATLVPSGGPAVSGLESIAALLDSFVSLKPHMGLEVKAAVRSGDIALLLSTWTLKETDANGEMVERSGQTSDVVRRQADGTWLLVIDIPYGAEAANY